MRKRKYEIIAQLTAKTKYINMLDIRVFKLYTFSNDDAQRDGNIDAILSYLKDLNKGNVLFL